MSLRLVNGKWKGGTKKDAAKLKSSKISSSKSSSRSSSSKPSYSSAQSSMLKMYDATHGTNYSSQYEKSYGGSSSKYAGPSLPGKVQSGYYDYSDKEKTKRDSNKNKSINESNPKSPSYKPKVNPVQRNNAAKVLGIATAKASGGTISQSPSKSWWERGLEILKDPLGIEPRARAMWNDQPFGNKMYETEQGAGDAIGKLLGGSLPELGVSERFGDTSGIFGSDNRVQSQPYEPSTPADVLNMGRGPINVPGVTDRPVNTSPKGNAPFETPVVKPFTPPGTSRISDVLNPFREAQDNTPIAGENGTVQRLAGRGLFSTGFAGNGAGNYGIEGILGGGTSPWNQDLLNNILGINTAQASENEAGGGGGGGGWGDPQSITTMNQKPSNFYQTTNPVPGYSDESQYEIVNGTPIWKKDTSKTTMDWLHNTSAGMDNTINDLKNQETELQNQLGQIDPNELATLQNYLQSGDISGLGGQVSGASTGLNSGGMMGGSQIASNQATDMDKYYSKQEKAQKKAQKELLKSIENQYKEGVETGTSELNKAKQEDLLKLSGLFSFANSDPNDEQRIQYQNRMVNDYAGKLNELIKGLASTKSQNVSEAKQNYQGVLAQIAQARAEQQQKIQQLVEQQQQQQFNNRLAILRMLGYGNNYATDEGAVDIFGNPV